MSRGNGGDDCVTGCQSNHSNETGWWYSELFGLYAIFFMGCAMRWNSLSRRQAEYVRARSESELWVELTNDLLI